MLGTLRTHVCILFFFPFPDKLFFFLLKYHLIILQCEVISIKMLSVDIWHKQYIILMQKVLRTHQNKCQLKYRFIQFFGVLLTATFNCTNKTNKDTEINLLKICSKRAIIVHTKKRISVLISPQLFYYSVFLYECKATRERSTILKFCTEPCRGGSNSAQRDFHITRIKQSGCSALETFFSPQTD